MGASIAASVLVFAFVAGCASGIQGGLANAPTLADATPETRVHDAVANGRDACERSAFPPGGVLRGQIPPCIKKERAALAPALAARPSPNGTWVSPSYPQGLCPSSGPGLVANEGAMTAASPWSSSDISCGSPL
jgi:hypothetical protein